MKSILTTYLLCIGIFFPLSSIGQEDTTAESGETILKLEKPLLKKGQEKWLNKSGFYTHTYDWSDPEINLNLIKGAKSHTRANWIGIVGGSILVLGLAANAMGSISKNISRPDEPYQVMKGPYYLGGAMAVTSIVLSFDSIAKVNKAKAARAKKSK